MSRGSKTIPATPAVSRNGAWQQQAPNKIVYPKNESKSFLTSGDRITFIVEGKFRNNVSVILTLTTRDGALSYRYLPVRS